MTTFNNLLPQALIPINVIPLTLPVEFAVNSSGGANKTTDAYSGNESFIGSTSGSILIRPLEESDKPRLFKCIKQSFGAVGKPFEMSDDGLGTRLSLSSYTPRFSVGAFYEKAMIGFWLSGLRSIDGEHHAYNAGTGVIHDWRKKGIAERMSLYVDSLLDTMGIRSSSLITNSDNLPAVELYKKVGFQTARQMSQFMAETNRFQKSGTITSSMISAAEAFSFEGTLLDHKPSWQNSSFAVDDVRHDIVAAMAQEGGEILAYGILLPRISRILQLGIKNMNSERKTSAVSNILNLLDEVTDRSLRFNITDIPDAESRLPEILSRLGFDKIHSSREMVKVY